MALDRAISSPASLASQTCRHDDDCVRPALIASKGTDHSSIHSRQSHIHSFRRRGMAAHVTAAPSLAVFRQRLKTFLFSRSYPDIVS